MTLKFRRWLYSTAILIFLISAPLLILYTAGFRYDFKKGKVQSTGSIFVKTIPPDPHIYLNNELVGEKTPLRLNHLAPNRYDLKIQKKGFQDWEKKLEVYPSQTTFIDKVILWPVKPEIETLINSQIKSFSINKAEDKIIWQQDNQLFLYNPLNQKSEQILTLPSESAPKFDWSPGGKRLIIKQNENYWLLSFSDKLDIKKINTIDSQAQTIKFHPEIDDLIIFIKNQRLYTYNLITKNIKRITNKEIQDYKWYKGKWFYITAGKPVMLSFFEPGSQNNTPPLFQLPESSNYSLVDIINNQALIYQPDSETLYVFNLNPEQFNNTSQIIKPVTEWHINSNKNKLLLNNNWEVWTFDLPTATTETINRTSRKISSTAWYKDTSYILIQYQDGLEIIETDNRGKRNRSKLIEEEIIQSKLGKKGEYIFVLLRSNEQNRLIKMKIAEFPLISF